jgi:outer membrane receptor protein involved in Fe transport
VNLDTTWHATKTIGLFARVVNLFDRHYATAGFLTSNSFSPDGTFRTDPGD